MTRADIDNIFSYHPVKEGQVEQYTAIREAGKAFALVILETTPASPDQSVAIRKVREAVMTANAAIALKEF